MCYKITAYVMIGIVIILSVDIVIIVVIIHANKKNSAWYFYFSYVNKVWLPKMGGGRGVVFEMGGLNPSMNYENLSWSVLGFAWFLQTLALKYSC